MELVTQAMIFAAQKHDGAVRKASRIPYIVHPMEAAAIAASITDDQEILAAAVLHDVMEDCGVSYGELHARFGKRVADLVFEDSNNQGVYASASWNVRKREAVRRRCDVYQVQPVGQAQACLVLQELCSIDQGRLRPYVRVAGNERAGGSCVCRYAEP